MGDAPQACRETSLFLSALLWAPAVGEAHHSWQAVEVSQSEGRKGRAIGYVAQRAQGRVGSGQGANPVQDGGDSGSGGA